MSKINVIKLTGKSGKGSARFGARVLLMLLFVCMALLPMSAAKAARDYPHVYDEAGLLTAEQASYLDAYAQEVSEKYQVDVSVIAVNSMNGKDRQSFTDDWFIDHGYGMGENGDGILFMLSMGERKYHMSTHGAAIDYFSDRDIESIGNEVKYYLSNGSYARGFETFITMCDEELNAETTPATVKPWMVIADLLAGFGIAAVPVAGMRSQLKSVRARASATDYRKRDSFRMTCEDDHFITSNVIAVPIPKPSDRDNDDDFSSTHMSSSGDTFGGGGGDF